MGHDAFISYRHGADADVAAAIEQGLERLARPWNRVRAMSVFRDQSDLAAESDLSGAITRTLDDTRFLVLLASPESAASPWVDKEVAYWCEHGKGLEHLVVVVTDGDFEWDEAAGALTPATDSVSPAVRSRFTTEPLYVDLRWARSAEDLSLRDSRFRSAIVLIAATIRGVAPADLESEDVRLHRRARRLARIAVASVLVLALVASVAAVAAVGNARRADRRAREALGRQLGLAALDMPASDVDQAFLLSLVAAGFDDGDDADRFQASRALIGRYSRLDQLLHAERDTASLRDVAIRDDGLIAAISTPGDGTTALLIWPAGARADPTVTTLPAGVGGAPPVAFIPGGRILVGRPGGDVATIDDDGTGLAPFSETLAVDLDGGIVAAPAADGSVTLSDLETGATLATADDAGAASGVVDLRYGRLAVVSEAEIVVLDGELRSSARANLPSGEPVSASAAGPSAAVAAVTASADGIVPWTWSGGAERPGTLRAGDAVVLPDVVGQPVEVTVAPDGVRVLVVGTAGSVVLNLTSGEADAVDRGSTGRVAVDPSGRYAAVGGARLTVWDLATGRATFVVPLPANAMAWSTSCEDAACKLVTAGESLDVWDPATRRRVPLIGQTNAQAVAVSADGDTVVTAGWGPTVAVWRLRPIVDDGGRGEMTTGEVERALWGAANRTQFGDGTACGSGLIALSPSGQYVVSHVDDGTTRVCDTGDGAVVASAPIRGNADPVTAVAVDDAGDIALGGGAGFVERYQRSDTRFATGAAIDARLGNEAVDVSSLATRDGTVVAGIRPADAAAVARVFVWPADDGGTPTQFDTDHLDVTSIALLGADASHVVVAGRDRADGPVTLQIWETSSRRRLGRALQGLSGDVVALGGDDAVVFGADSGGRAWRWSLDRDPTREICAIVGRPLDAEEWRGIVDGALGGYDPQPVCDR